MSVSSDPPGPILRPEDLGNLPGFLTLGRLLLAVLLPIWTYDRLALFLVLSAAMLSDIVDGMLARRWGLSSRIGAVLDGWIDKD